MKYQEIDITARIMVLTLERYAMIDFPNPLIIGSMVILQPLPQWKMECNAIFQPFHTSVYIESRITNVLVLSFI